MPHQFSAAFSTAFDTVHDPIGSWDTLLGFVQEARDIDQKDRSTPPTSCPVDYTALREGPDGILYCPWGSCGGLQWPRDASAWGEFPGSF